MRNLFVSFNLGGYFDHPDPEQFNQHWVTSLVRIAHSTKVPFIAIHFQELGGKKKKVELIEPFIEVVHTRMVKEGYWSSRMFTHLDVKSDFTALGSIFYILNSELSNYQIWNFKEERFSLASETSSLTPIDLFQSYCQHVRISFGDAKARKGYLHTRWMIQGMSLPLNLVNVHLVHDESNIVATVDSFPSGYAIRRLRALNTILNNLTSMDSNSYLFLFGDFNFRLNLNHFVPWLAEMETKRRAKANYDSAARQLKDWTENRIRKSLKQQSICVDTNEKKASFSDIFGQSVELSDKYNDINAPSFKEIMKNFEDISSGTKFPTRNGQNGDNDSKYMLLFAMSSLSQTVLSPTITPSSSHLTPQTKVDNGANLWQSIKSFFGFSSETRSTMRPVSISISPEEVENIRFLFDFIDTNHDGKLSAVELCHCLYRFCGFRFTNDEMKQVIKIIDFDKSGDLDFTEFLTLMNTIASVTEKPKSPSDILFIDVANNEVTPFPTGSPKMDDNDICTNIQQPAHLAIEKKDPVKDDYFKVIRDEFKSISLKDKKFIFPLTQTLVNCAEFRLLVKHFDNELSLFNDYRAQSNLPLLYEMDVAFPPTYPLQKDRTTDDIMEYSDLRCPAWVDRVLMNKASRDNILSSAKSSSEDLIELEETLKSSAFDLLGIDPKCRLSAESGNFYAALNPHSFVSDHCSVILFVNLT
eukprot:c20778_g3_i1.p1 GENE.c20778_g3_i1~~c20778_g3_i1.p1  ORF type:complete len:698 (+),score=217.57 c20778_g3_i1:139-2232(+)